MERAAQSDSGAHSGDHACHDTPTCRAFPQEPQNERRAEARTETGPRIQYKIEHYPHFTQRNSRRDGADQQNREAVCDESGLR